MPKIYRDVPPGSHDLIGWIDPDDGSIYDSTSGRDRYLGEVDYDEGEVYDDTEEFMGWVEDDGRVFASYPGEPGGEDVEECLGYVDEDGRLFVYADDEEEEELYVGYVTEMTDEVEGAAALLFFFDEGI